MHAASSAWQWGSRYRPGAFQHDVMLIFCDLVSGAWPESNGTNRLYRMSE